MNLYERAPQEPAETSAHSVAFKLVYIINTQNNPSQILSKLVQGTFHINAVWG